MSALFPCPCCGHSITAQDAAGFRILGPDEVDQVTVDRCAVVAAPKGSQPCDCDRCYCGNIGDAEMASAWDQQQSNAAAIRAIGRKA